MTNDDTPSRTATPADALHVDDVVEAAGLVAAGARSDEGVA